MIVLSTWPGRSRRSNRQNSHLFLFRDILITPKRLSYAREKEKDLYESLLALTNSKQNELQRLILQTINEMEETLADQACSLEMPGKTSGTAPIVLIDRYAQGLN